MTMTATQPSTDVAATDQAGVSSTVAPAGPNLAVASDHPVAAAAATGTTTGGLSFDFTIGGKTYTVTVTSQDANGQRGFTITQAGAAVASFIYLSSTAWQVKAGLPTPLKIDDNFTINAFTLDVQQGTVQALS